MPEETDAGDSPPEIADLLEGDGYRIAVTLEPAGADETGYRKLTDVVLRLAERVAGVAENRESGSSIPSSDGTALAGDTSLDIPCACRRL